MSKIPFANQDANKVLKQGTYIINLFSAGITNYPTKDTFGILEVISTSNGNSVYMFQRISTFNGSIYIRSKTNDNNWSPWNNTCSNK